MPVNGLRIETCDNGAFCGLVGDVSCEFVNNAITLPYTALNSQGIYLFNDVNYLIKIGLKVFFIWP